MKLYFKSVLLIAVSFSGFAKTNFFVSPKDPSGQLLLNPFKETKSLFPVSLLTVNGNNVANRKNSVWLKPGHYELTFSSIVDLRFSGGNGVNVNSNIGRYRNKEKILSIDVEEGKKYYIGFDAHELDKAKWKPVIWKIQ